MAIQSNNFVGIGTTIPLQQLHVQDNIYITGLAGIGGTNVRNTLDVQGTMLVTSSVGIGTTIPTTLLHVQGSSYIARNIGIGTTIIRNNLDVQGTVIITANLGIGTTIPRSNLDVVGSGMITDLTVNGSMYVTNVSRIDTKMYVNTMVACNMYVYNPNDVYIPTTTNILCSNIAINIPALQILQDSTMVNQPMAIVYDTQNNTMTPKFCVATNGNVGIGTSTTIRQFHTHGDVYFNGNVGIGVLNSNASFTLAPGTTSVAPMVFSQGVLCTSNVQGAIEYDGSALYTTMNTTSGRGELPPFYTYLITADRSSITGGSTVDYFPANSSIQLEANSYYEFEAMCFFGLVGSSSTVIWSWNFSTTVTNVYGLYRGTGIGFTTSINNTSTFTGVAASRNSTDLLYAVTSGTMTGGRNQCVNLKGVVVTNTACNIRLRVRVTNSATSIVIYAGSYYTVKKISGTTGNFVA